MRFKSFNELKKTPTSKLNPFDLRAFLVCKKTKDENACYKGFIEGYNFMSKDVLGEYAKLKLKQMQEKNGK